MGAVKVVAASFFALLISFKNILLGKTTRANDDASNNQQQIELDKKLVFSLSRSRVPSWQQLKYLKKFLTPREIWIIRINLIIIVLCLVFFGVKFYRDHLQVVPVSGGRFVEALVGSPVHINPLYASVNDVDNDLSTLVYSSLFKRGKSGELVNDLVSNYEVSSDGKVYTITLRSDAKWQTGNSLISGTPVNADDVAFTFSAIQNKQYNSPLRPSFSGVALEKIDDYKIKFALSEPYAAFLDLLTFGIIPANLWGEIAPGSFELAQYQKKPIGSGPYSFSKFTVDQAGNMKEYDLIANKNYYGAKPYIDLGFKFYPSWDEAISALNSNDVDGISYLPIEQTSSIKTPKSYNFNKLFLPQLTAVFFNKDQAIFSDKAIRQALAYAINRDQIIKEVLGGGAYLVDGPILPNSFAYNKDIKKYNYDSAKAGQMLEAAGWKLIEISAEQIKQATEQSSSTDLKIRDEANKILDIGAGKWRQKDNTFLTIRLGTVDRGENQAVVAAIAKYWEDAGVKVKLEVLTAVQIKTDVIKNRNFDALFYSQTIGADPDPYPFWHSSQANGAGLNITDFANKEVDQILEDARLTSDIAKRQELYKKFQDIVAEDEPAIFMYSPAYIYLQSNNIKGFAVKNIILPSDRFANVADWYIQTGRKLVW
jgi:peptide/nickel transport system substrate-binding protein